MFRDSRHQKKFMARSIQNPQAERYPQCRKFWRIKNRHHKGFAVQPGMVGKQAGGMSVFTQAQQYQIERQRREQLPSIICGTLVGALLCRNGVDLRKWYGDVIQQSFVG